MKPARFDYLLPRDLPHALGVLAANAGSARLLAGGQSLMPLLNMRLASPAILVDINRLTELVGISDGGDTIRVGAMTRYSELEASELIATELPLIPAALKQVAHPAIRNRGTIGGSLALADPAGEIPAVALALDATIIAHSARGERRIQMDEFLQGIWDTALAEDEIIIAVEFPKRGRGERFAFREFARRHGDFALAGLILLVGGDVAARCVVFGIGARAMRVPAVEAWMDRKAVAAAPAAEIQAALSEAVFGAIDDPEEAVARARIAVTLLVRALPDLAHRGAAA